MTVRDDVVRDALGWQGTPYHHRGRIKGVGVDCGGLLYEVYNSYCGPFRAFPDYSYDWALHKDKEVYLDFISPYVTEVEAVPKGGFTLVKSGRALSHAGIYLGNGDGYIHAGGLNMTGIVKISSAEKFLQRRTVVRHFDLIWNT